MAHRPRSVSLGNNFYPENDKVEKDSEIKEHPIQTTICKEKWIEPPPDDYEKMCPIPELPKALKDTTLSIDTVVHMDSPKKLEITEGLFKDKTFPSKHKTHYFLPKGDTARGVPQNPERLVWERISNVFKNPHFIQDKYPKPDDVVQGKLGNCWFLGSVATLASSQKHFELVVPKPWPSFDEQDSNCM